MTITRYFALIFLCFFIMLISACRIHKATSGSISIKTDSSAGSGDVREILSKADANRLPYDWYSSRIKVEYSDGQQSQDFTAVVRMRRDSLLWLSLQGPFGIEGARILISRDTIKLINRLSGEYLCQPISGVVSMLPVQADMTMLQDFILGYYMHFSGVAATYRGLEDSLHQVQAESPQMRYRAQLYPQNYTLAKSVLTDKMTGQEMRITFEGYSTEQGKPFSGERIIDLKQGSKAYNLHLSYSKVKINEPLAFPFEVAPGLRLVDKIRF